MKELAANRKKWKKYQIRENETPIQKHQKDFKDVGKEEKLR